MEQPDRAECVAAEQQFERRILHDHFVRFHMSVILTAVIASGVLGSRGMLLAGVHSLPVRYPLAVIASYLVFLGLVRVWIWYVSLRCAPRVGVGGVDLGNGSWSLGRSGRGGVGSVRFGGGSSGGGGASTSWDSNVAAASMAPPAPGRSGWLPKFNFDFDFGDDGWVLILLAVLVLAIVGSAGYLVWVAPHVLPEAAGQALLAGTLTRISKEEHHDWMRGVLKSTWIPFLVVLILAGALGWEAHRHCPGASRLMEVLYCPTGTSQAPR